MARKFARKVPSAVRLDGPKPRSPTHWGSVEEIKGYRNLEYLRRYKGGENGDGDTCVALELEGRP